jgi:hypothetical protein
MNRTLEFMYQLTEIVRYYFMFIIYGFIYKENKSVKSQRNVTTFFLLYT